ncbi:MAG: A24 family peptidase [Methylomonas sp.]|uniref:prepilin peptidase n=1 Tax=Methylomonas sp. TaxID=418 RepID=UPI0025DCDA10|nr:A24 family peptidase [Methylomonas sp.]MCK9605307.1 A24 family peptidase [Methylomonas sp.]
MLITTMQQSPVLLIVLASILGLMIGSFLNVVIYRLPVMMRSGWRRECLEYLQMPAEEVAETFNLLWPGSRCPACKTEIKAYQNIPVLSYLWLRGKCGHCSAPISLRYPLIEVFTGLCSALVAWHFGYGLPMLFGLLLTWCLIALSFIDIDQQLLPDSITLPVLWLGLFLSLFSIYTDAHASIIGAVAGYLSLWSVYYLFKLLTGKEGMGFGDFKLLALLGAWLGWQYLPLIIILSSLVGACIGVTMIIFRQHDASRPMPFGPYLAAAGWLALIWGSDLNRLYLNFVGL